ncbi:ABC transporter ATP-binding protein [Lichenifustis flavocetrariae]|uniref:Glutathione import ATP-binding protein GsiA n=1 Tax=Lichenifustis flavocetrariae TaxID=2949735 RepID=A0AA42CQD8_9HYPH|nr:ABC transporter ATP-binding protein [Lichenifustis flavocetrariae]MCW6511357.1 ABC transporter ATP-binding protein [Lichenifustis flavocetrariae]
MTTPEPLLAITDLSIDARTPEGLRPVLDGVSFALVPGETLCLAGESGSGKSLTALSIMRLLSPSLRQRGGSIKLAGRELTTLPERAMRQLRGGDIAMIFQEPMTSLNPVMTIGAQLTEAIRIHGATDGGSAETRARAMLDAVHINEPARRLGQYPHELSGGMRQRVMIAMALSCRPKVLIADEPTTALDVTVQAQILTLMRELKGEFGTSIILITHDMGVVAEMADRVALLRAGRMVEQGSLTQIFEQPREAYTKQLLDAVPRLGAFRGTDGPPRVTAAPPPVLPAGPILFVRDLEVTYGGATGWFGRGSPPPPVVKRVNFELKAGETLGLVGESGSGKSTIGKAVLGLIPFTGEVVIDGVAIAGLSPGAMKPVRRKAQMIFQDPYASLDPRMSVGESIAEPLAIHGIGTRNERRERVALLLRRVHLTPDQATRYPHEFSGGQRQRICIARALALEPKIIVADESVSALDVSVRAHVLDLLLELQEEMGLSYLFISHDMAVVERMSHQVAVMRGGAFVETGSRRAVFENPVDTYTRALMRAVPVPIPSTIRHQDRVTASA